MVSERTLSTWLVAVALVCLGSQASASDWHYKVRPGDSLWVVCERVAARPDHCRQHLADYNRLPRPNRVLPGDILSFPVSWLKPGPMPARLAMQRGDVMRYPAAGGPAQPLRDHQSIAAGDAIETGDGAALLRFPDQAEVLVKPRSLLIVRGYCRYPGRPGDTGMRLQRGAVYVHRLTPVMKKSQFRVYTPGGAVTVRGTEYDLQVDHRETTRGEVRAGRLEVRIGDRHVALTAGQGILVEAGPGPIESRPLLPAPALRLSGGRHGLRTTWVDLPGAQAYWLELYALPERTLLAQTRLSGDDWQRHVPPGRYHVQVRAIDNVGLRGRIASANVRVGAPIPVAPRATGPVPPKVAPPRQQRSHKKRDLWIFLGAAALMMTL